MYTSIDEGKGLVQLYWQDIRERVASVEPYFAQLVDELDPGVKMPLYLVYLPYGAYKGDTSSSFLPTLDGGYCRLNSPEIPTIIEQHLGYGKHSSPFGMVLDKEIEYFIQLPGSQHTIPSSILKAGQFFNFSRMLNGKERRVFAPNGVLCATAGVRSTFMLPNIGSMVNHVGLQRDFNLQLPAAKKLNQHWRLFKALANHPNLGTDWSACLLYLSKSWLDCLLHDKAWLKLKMYLFEQAWHSSDYHRHHYYYDAIFSMIQQKRNLKPNPYLADTARHLFQIALGHSPGFVPACDDSALPLHFLQRCFVDSYGLSKYIPTIIRPSLYQYEEAKAPSYYSLQNPASFAFSPKSRNASSTLFEIRELENLTRIFCEELADGDGACDDTIIAEVARGIDFRYFHNKMDSHSITQSSSQIAKTDPRFNYMDNSLGSQTAVFSSDAKFFRGCIQLSKLDNTFNESCD